MVLQTMVATVQKRHLCRQRLSSSKLTSTSNKAANCFESCHRLTEGICGNEAYILRNTSQALLRHLQMAQKAINTENHSAKPGTYANFNARAFRVLAYIGQP